MLRFYKGEPANADAGGPGRVGIFPGAFNPVTRAHLALARAAIEQHTLAQVVFLLPKNFPHKQYVGAGFADRITLLRAALADQAGCAIASSEKGLFHEIAAEAREHYPPSVELFLLCGRDAAERIVNWDYGDGPNFARQIEHFQLLAASRGGDYEPPAALRKRIHAIRLPPKWSGMSASAVREAMRRDQDWESLVPPAAARLIREKGLYR